MGRDNDEQSKCIERSMWLGGEGEAVKEKEENGVLSRKPLIISLGYLKSIVPSL